MVQSKIYKEFFFLVFRKKIHLIPMSVISLAVLKVWAERFACHSKVCARSLSPAWWHQPLIKTTFPQMSCGPQRWSTPIAQSFSDHLCSVFFQDAVLYLLSEGKNYEENHIRCYEEMWLKKKKIFPYNWSHSGEWRIAAYTTCIDTEVFISLPPIGRGWQICA